MFPLPPGGKLNRLPSVRGPHHLHGPIRYSSALFAAFQIIARRTLLAARTNLVSRQRKPFPLIENRRRPSPFQNFLPPRSRSKALPGPPRMRPSSRKPPRANERLILIMSRPNLFPPSSGTRTGFKLTKIDPLRKIPFPAATDGKSGKREKVSRSKGQKSLRAVVNRRLPAASEVIPAPFAGTHLGRIKCQDQ